MAASFDSEATARLVSDIGGFEGDPEEVARHVVPLLGGRHLGDERASFGFWIPHLGDHPQASVDLELCLVPPDLDLTAAVQEVEVRWLRYPMEVVGEYAVAVVRGVPAGTRHDVGAFYRAVVQLPDETVRVGDVLALSMPFGAFAPAELINLEELHAGRDDADHFRSLADASSQDVPRLGPPANLLQVHPGTATAGGTLAALTRRLQDVAERVRAGQPLDPSDELWLDYEAIELMPVEPTIVPEADPPAWEELDDVDGMGRVRLRRPQVTDWGYDVPLAGAAAVNPAILESGRPHELVDLASALHRFPSPLRLVIDVVYGHADNQALSILHPPGSPGPICMASTSITATRMCGPTSSRCSDGKRISGPMGSGSTGRRTSPTGMASGSTTTTATWSRCRRWSRTWPGCVTGPG